MILAGIKVEPLDDRLDARTAQDLLLHRRQPRVQVLIDDRLDVVLRNLLLLDEHQGLRHVLRSWDVADAEADSEKKDRAGQNQPDPALQYFRVVLDGQITMPEHNPP